MQLIQLLLCSPRDGTSRGEVQKHLDELHIAITEKEEDTEE